MIKINLLAVERQRPAKKKLAFTLDLGQKVTAICGVILVAAAAVVGWRYWSLGRESSRLDGEIIAAQQEATGLRTVIAQVQQFEERRTQLEQRVALIEQLRREQSGPVHMLDQISRALPPMLWLTDLKQGPSANDVVIEGRCTTMTGLSDFVSNLEASGYFRRSVEIVSSEMETVGQPPMELIRFSIRGIFEPPGAAPASASQPAPSTAATPAAPLSAAPVPAAG
jgi:type IV pilus assembly protein PilN